MQKVGKWRGAQSFHVRSMLIIHIFSIHIFSKDAQWPWAPYCRDVYGGFIPKACLIKWLACGNSTSSPSPLPGGWRVAMRFQTLQSQFGCSAISPHLGVFQNSPYWQTQLWLRDSLGITEDTPFTSTTRPKAQKMLHFSYYLGNYHRFRSCVRGRKTKFIYGIINHNITAII